MPPRHLSCRTCVHSALRRIHDPVRQKGQAAVKLYARSREVFLGLLSLSMAIAMVALFLMAPQRAFAAETTVHVQNAGNQQNCGDELLFVLNGLTGDFQAPSTITVTYEGGITQV